MVAIISENVRLVKILLDSGADELIKDGSTKKGDDLLININGTLYASLKEDM